MPYVSLFQFFNGRWKSNFSFDGENLHSAGFSKYSHRQTYGIANYKGKALSTGCYDTTGCDVKTEVMDLNTMTWTDGPDYPFSS